MFQQCSKITPSLENVAKKKEMMLMTSWKFVDDKQSCLWGIEWVDSIQAEE